jgi:hypothetical protein
MQIPITAWLPLITCVVGLLSGAAGAYIGVKVAVTKLEVWREIIIGRLGALERNTDLHRDDIYAHDFELGTILEKLGLNRVSRQRIRD